MSIDWVPDPWEPELREEAGWAVSNSVGAGNLGSYVFLPSLGPYLTPAGASGVESSRDNMMGNLGIGRVL